MSRIRFDTKTLDVTYPAEQGAAALDGALDRLCDRAEAAVHGGYNIIILSDRLVGPDRIPIPALLATAAVHNYLIRKGLRTSVGLVVESGEPREVHHFACLAGYGAEAINPYLAFETMLDMHERGELPVEVEAKEVVKRYIKSIGKGLLKVMSKMGISTYQSYCGAQIFDAVGLSSKFVDRDFFGTATTIEGAGMAEIAEETVRRHRDAFGDAPVYRTALDVGGEYAFRFRGENHVWNADTVRDLQHAVRGNLPDKYRAFAARINAQDERFLTIRGLFDIKDAAADGREPVPLEEVEPAADIVRRFSTGAMSFGSISREAHTTLAIAMNRIGGKSNTGEGGEEADRFRPLPNGEFDALGDQAGGLGALWRHDRVPRQLGHDADQDGAGGKARRGRPASRPQGRRGDRQGAALDPRRRPDLAAAASRHLFDRGSGAADLRSQERQPVSRRVRQARLRGRRRHGRGRRREGARRPRHHRGLRGRHRRLAADLDQACRLAVGDRPLRDPPDARAQPAARRASRSRSTAASAPGATSSSARCSAPTSSASRPRR